MAKILAQIEAHNIGNIRLLAGDAAELLAWVPPGSLARIDLIHPDPWPKRRHWKRRFVQDTTVAAMARALKPGGEFRFVSDIADYCAWTLCASFALDRFRLDRGAELRLAPALGRLHHDALRTQSRARRPRRGLSAFPEDRLERRHQPRSRNRRCSGFRQFEQAWAGRVRFENRARSGVNSWPRASRALPDRVKTAISAATYGSHTIAY